MDQFEKLARSRALNVKDRQNYLKRRKAMGYTILSIMVNQEERDAIKKLIDELRIEKPVERLQHEITLVEGKKIKVTNALLKDMFEQNFIKPPKRYKNLDNPRRKPRNVNITQEINK